MSKIIELLAHYPPYQLVHAAEMVRDTFEQFYQQRYQLTVPQWRLMMVLGPHYPISQKELVEASGMDKVRISREIHRLVEKGILFTESSAQDKRISLVSFTPAGSPCSSSSRPKRAAGSTPSPTICPPRRARAYGCICKA